MDKNNKAKLIYIVLIFSQLFFVKCVIATNWELLRYEVIGGVSVCNYFGDIGGATTDENWYGIKDIELFSSRPSLYFGARYYLKERIAVQSTLNFGIAQGSDKNSKYPDRAYNFTTSFLMPKINFEYTLFKVNDLLGKKKHSFLTYNKPMNKTFILYCSAGAGFSFYKIKLNDKMKADKIRTDTLPNSSFYVDVNKTSAFVWSAGLGMRYFFIKALAINIGLEYNSLLSDNFDGFTTATNVNDLFWMVSFGLNYRLPTDQWGKINFNKKKKKTNSTDEIKFDY